MSKIARNKYGIAASIALLILLSLFLLFPDPVFAQGAGLFPEMEKASQGLLDSFSMPFRITVFAICLIIIGIAIAAHRFSAVLLLSVVVGGTLIGAAVPIATRWMGYWGA